MRKKDKLVSDMKLRELSKFFSSNQKCKVAAIVAGFMFFVGTFGLVEYLNASSSENFENISPVSEKEFNLSYSDNYDLSQSEKTTKENFIEKLQISTIEEQSKQSTVTFMDVSIAQEPVNAGTLLNPSITPLVPAVLINDKEPLQKECPVTYVSSISRMDDKIKDTSLFDVQKTVYLMTVNGKTVGTFENPDDAKKVIDKIVEQKTDSNAKLIDVKYKENVDVKKTDMSFLAFEKYSSIEETVNFLMTGTKEQKEYSIKAGDIPETIAESNGMTIEELEQANPSIVGRGHLLQIGEKLNLVVPVPMLNVLTTEKQQYKDQIKYETIKEEDSEMYEGESIVKVAGANGEREVVAEIKRENGIEVGRKIVSENILTQPTSEVLIVGTKPAPPRKGTGVFDVPIARGYTISSEFGPRWGGMHTGLDMACSTGTPILAADGGQVISSGWDGSYGYAIKIDHGGNIVTKYAHCSALYVSEGDMVFKGQHIADVGSTGRSTGSHLHFEVIKNGSFMNPRYYIFSD